MGKAWDSTGFWRFGEKVRELEGINLHDWQEHCLDAWVANGYRGTVSVATGAGKTVLALAAIKRLWDGPIFSKGQQLRVKVIVPRVFLAQQWRQEAIRLLGISPTRIGLYYGAQKCDPSLPFVIYVLDSARRNVARHIIADVGTHASVDANAKDTDAACVDIERAGAAEGAGVGGVNIICAGVAGAGAAGAGAAGTGAAGTEAAATTVPDAGRSVFLICDEVHHFGSTENMRVFDFVTHIPSSRYFALGLSATPRCEHFNDRIAPAVGDIIFEYDLKRASRQGITASYHLFRIAVGLNGDECDRYDDLTDAIARTSGRLVARCPELRGLRGQEFFASVRRLSAQTQGEQTALLARNLISLILKRRAVVVLAAARIDCAIDLLSRLPYGTRVILFSERIRSADELFTRIEALYPGRASRYHSLMEPAIKQRALEAYRSGETPVIVCCRALDEGLDVPLTDVGIIASSGTNLRQRIQRMGRILRKSDTGQIKRIFYLFVPSTSETSELLWSDETDGADAAAVADGDIGSGEVVGGFEKGLEKKEIPSGSAGTDLYHDIESQCLINHDYDVLADRVMAGLESKGATSRQLETVSRQLRRGAIALDYLMDESECRMLLGKAVREEKAYLQTMLLMIQETAKDLRTVGQ